MENKSKGKGLDLGNMANLLAVEGFSSAPMSPALSAALWGPNALSSPSLFSLAWRTSGNTLAAGVVMKSSTEESVALYHVRRSLAGKALRAGPGVVVEVACESGGESGARLYDVEAAHLRLGITHMLSTAIPGTAQGQGKAGSPAGALTIGFLEPEAPSTRVKDALLELAAELAQTLPERAPELLEDVQILCPAKSIRAGSCACCKESVSAVQNPLLLKIHACRELPGRRHDYDGSAGPSCSPTTSKAALQEIPVSSSTDAVEVVEGSTSAEPEDSAAPLSAKKRLRYEKLMRIAFRQDPLWLTFKDPQVEQAFLLHSAKKACVRDFGLMVIMMVYVAIAHQKRPFFLASLDPVISYSLYAFGAAFLLFYSFQEWYLKNRAAAITLWMVSIRMWELWFVTVVTASSSAALPLLAAHWMWIFPIQHAFDAIMFVLTVKRHFYLRLVLAVMGCAAASQAFPQGYWGRSPALASAWSIFNLLLAEVLCFKLTTKWEAEARTRFAREKASRALLHVT